MKHLAIIPAFMATPVAAFDGLTIGANIGAGQFVTEPTNATDDLTAYGLHGRYLWRSEGGNILLGVEASRQRVSGSILGREDATWLTDVSGVIGYDLDPWMPHLVGGYSHLRTSLHGSDGYHVGAGVTRALGNGWQVTLRGTYREFDGPAQGSDLIVPTASVMFEYRF